MKQDTLNVPSLSSASTVGDQQPQSSTAPVQPVRPDGAALVARMVEAGEWPEPELMEEIVAAGDVAVEPLLAILRSKPRGWTAETPLVFAVGLLHVIRPPAAIPALIEILRSYSGDPGQLAADALATYGEAAFEPLLEVASDPAVTGYYRTHAIISARKAAGDNPGFRARLAELLRPMLADAIDQALRHIADAPPEDDWDEFDEIDDFLDPDDDEDDEDSGPDPAQDPVETQSADASLEHEDTIVGPADPDEDDENVEVTLIEEISFRVTDLAALADPLARDLIKTAFAEDLVETFSIHETDVDALYGRGGDPLWVPPDWLDLYRHSYRNHLGYLERERHRRETPTPRVDPEPWVPPPQPVITASIRNAGPKVGRNDPCWCGSGKKYKKCHLGKDFAP